MTSIVKRILRRLHIMPTEFSKDDMIDASTEDQARDHEDLVTKLQGTLFKREVVNERMRESIKIARQATSSFGEFERFARREDRKRHD